MAVQLTIDYETLIQLVEQLPIHQKQSLVERLIHVQPKQALSAQDKAALFEKMTVSTGQLLTGYSDRRADWYEDDGR